jgi:hypothetical protein
MPLDVVALLRDLYGRCRAGEMSDTEARWVLQIVLPVYGKTLEDVARWARSA